MNRLTVHEASADLLGLLSQINSDHAPREITSEQGNAVLISKAEWESWQETRYLQSIPGLVESVRAAEGADDGVSEAVFDENLLAQDWLKPEEDEAWRNL